MSNEVKRWRVLKGHAGYASDIAESHYQIEEDGGFTIAVTVGDCVDNERANAYLIVAAPELLSAARSALEMMEEAHSHVSWCRHRHQRLNDDHSTRLLDEFLRTKDALKKQLEAAITKAEGA